MSDGWELWVWRLFNDPILGNPWAFGFVALLAVLTLAGFVLVIWKPEGFRRRGRS